MLVETAQLINVAISTAVTGLTTTPVAIPTIAAPFQQRDSVTGLTLYATFAYGSGGTTAKAWVQTSFDGGVTWMDIASFAFTTAAAQRVYHLTAVAVTAIATPTEGTLANNTSVNGFLGGQFRVKYTTTGTYAGATSLAIVAMPK
jgi:hypothetical protein